MLSMAATVGVALAEATALADVTPAAVPPEAISLPPPQDTKLTKLNTNTKLFR